jgi:predicted ATP-dependent endonuclease of OLD family
MKLTAIRLDDTIFPNYKTSQDDNALTELSQINIFIGVNNSGKSRLMRTIFSNSDFFYSRNDVNLEELNLKIREFHDKFLEAIQRSFDSKIFIRGLIEKANYKFLKLNMALSSDVTDKLKSYTYFTAIPISMNGREGTYEVTQNQNALKIRKDYLIFIPDLALVLQQANTNFTKTYIPILRGLRPVQISNPQNFTNTNNYKERTKVDYFKDNKDVENLSISTGLDFYDELDRLKRGNDYQQVLIELFERFLGDTFFQGKKIRITPHKEKDVVTFKIGDSESRPIYELGDGIQAIILLTYPLFFNQGKDMIFFFEEPETHLHPGFQRIFIETLQRKEFSSFQYFITTHSNHFLDITLDQDNISIHSFRKKKDNTNQFLIENVKSGDNNVLQEIGVKNASVFLSNCTIWVEGITDRIYIRKYLEVFMNSTKNTDGVIFREDYHYSFVEYSGGNITHWSFLDDQDSNHPNINVNRICNHLFLITDQDDAGEIKDGNAVDKKAKQERHEKLRTKLGDANYHCLDCREIENSLSPEILKAVIKEREAKNPNFAFKTKGYEFEKYQYAKLGKYIDDHIENGKRKFQDDSGTIYDKSSFAKSAFNHIKTIQDLSQPAFDLTQKIYEFIKRHNID